MRFSVGFCFFIVSFSGLSQVHRPPGDFPVQPILFLDGFGGCEGIAFNGKGEMYVSGTKALWRISPDAGKVKVADLQSNLGVCAIGEEDLLVADFGTTNAFQNQKNNDGIVWRITPAGNKTEFIKGIGDPNFLLIRKDGKILVSDDVTNEIFLGDRDGSLQIFCTAVNHPNGLALSPDESTLYVAQIFQNIRPVVADNRVWSIPLKDGKPFRTASVLCATGPNGANDGLAMDEQGRLYIAANGEGKIWRFDLTTQEMQLICENVYGAASIAFGEGKFDPESIYVTTTTAGGRGGKIWQVKVGARGMKLNR